jgi:ketosteroid isomerase-like protein
MRILVIAIILIAGIQMQAGSNPVEDAYFAEVSASNQEYVRFIIASDLDGLMTLYADDVVYMPPGQATIYGKAGIREIWASYFANFDTISLISTIDAVAVSSELAFARGHYQSSVRDKKDGAIYHEAGTFAETNRRDGNGIWRVTNEIWNLDAPLIVENIAQ